MKIQFLQIGKINIDYDLGIIELGFVEHVEGTNCSFVSFHFDEKFPNPALLKIKDFVDLAALTKQFIDYVMGNDKSLHIAKT